MNRSDPEQSGNGNPGPDHRATVYPLEAAKSSCRGHLDANLDASLGRDTTPGSASQDLDSDLDADPQDSLVQELKKSGNYEVRLALVRTNGRKKNTKTALKSAKQHAAEEEAGRHQFNVVPLRENDDHVRAIARENVAIQQVLSYRQADGTVKTLVNEEVKVFIAARVAARTSGVPSGAKHDVRQRAVRVWVACAFGAGAFIALVGSDTYDWYQASHGNRRTTTSDQANGAVYQVSPAFATSTRDPQPVSNQLASPPAPPVQGAWTQPLSSSEARR